MDELEIAKQLEETESVKSYIVEDEDGFVRKTNYCKYCGEKMPKDAIICIKCGRQNIEIKKLIETSDIINNNSSVNNYRATANNTNLSDLLNIRKKKKKWITMILIFLLGAFGGHKFYEGKYITGIVYMMITFTGLGTIVTIFACIIDFIQLLFEPSVYYV